MNGAKPLGSDNPATLPVVLAFLSAVLWGIWWIPIRWLSSQGLGGAWGSVTMNAGAAITLLVLLLICRVPLRLDARTMIGAALVGGAVATYSVAVNLSDVVRVILLFYLAPAWSKIIEWAFMGKSWSWVSSLTVSLSLIGAYLVLGGNLSLAQINFGDFLALTSGVCWSVGATLIFTGRPSHALALSFSAAFLATCISVAFLLLSTNQIGLAEWMQPALGIGAGMGAVYVVPILLLTMWSAQRLSPAVITFLLTAEILSGVISGALLLDEPFGMMQGAGAVLILAAAAGEVVPQLVRKST